MNQKDYQLQVSEKPCWNEIAKEKEREGEGSRKARGGKKEHVSSHLFSRTHPLLGTSFPTVDGLTV